MNGNYEIACPDEVVDIYFDLIKLELPDFKWEYRDLNEMILFDLDDTCYGLFYNY